MAESIEDPEESLATRSATRSPLDARSGAALVAVAFALLGLLAWRALRPARVKRDPGLSVLLVSDRHAAGGRARLLRPPRTRATPWIDRLAAEGVRFETRPGAQRRDPALARQPAVRPVPAAPRRSRQHGLPFPGRPAHARHDPAREGLAHGRLRQRVPARFPLRPRPGLRGLRRPGGRGRRPTAFAMPERPGSRDGARRRAGGSSRSRDQRWFAFVHLYEPHFPYEPPEPFASRFPGEPYHGEVAAADAALGPLLEPLLSAGARTPRSRRLHLRPRRVARRARRGDPRRLRLRGDAARAARASRPAALPAARGRPRRCGTSTCSRPCSTSWGSRRPPTCRAAACCRSSPGREDAAPESYLESLSPSLNRGWAPLRGIVDGEAEVRRPAPPRALRPRRRPRRAAEPRRLAAAGPRSAARPASPGSGAGDVGLGARVQEDEAALERLRALGYVAGGGVARKARYTAEDDPKHLIDLDARIEDVITLYRAGDVDGGDRGVRGDPPPPPRHAAGVPAARLPRAGARAARLRGRRVAQGGGPAAARRRDRLAPRRVPDRGRARRGRRCAFLEPTATARRPDIDVLTALGMAQARAGERDGRARHLRPGPGARPHERHGPRQRRHRLPDGRRPRARPAGLRGRPRRSTTAWRAPTTASASSPPGRAGPRRRSSGGSARWPSTRGTTRRSSTSGARCSRRGAREEARPYLEAYLRIAPVALESRDRERVRGWLREGAGS